MPVLQALTPFSEAVTTRKAVLHAKRAHWVTLALILPTCLNRALLAPIKAQQASHPAIHAPLASTHSLVSASVTHRQRATNSRFRTRCLVCVNLVLIVLLVLVLVR